MTVHRVAKSAIVTSLQYLAAIAAVGLLLPSTSHAFDVTVDVIECGPSQAPNGPHYCDPIAQIDGDGGDIAEFTYLVNEDNTNVPDLDERGFVGSGQYPPAAPPSTGPMASHSPVVGAGDQDSPTVDLSPDCGQASSYDDLGNPNGCRYLISARAANHKWWGRHVTVLSDGSILDSDGNDLGGTVTIALHPDPIPLSNLQVQLFEDFSIPNGFPDVPFEIDNDGATTDMSGFHILIEDVTGEVVVDFFNNPLCGSGICLTNAAGQVTIQNLAHGKYEVFAIPPDGSDWVQTTTFEGTKAVDAWLEEGSDGTGAPGELMVEPAVRTAHFFGFVSDDGRDTGCGGIGTITGTARNWVPFPPFETLTFGAPVDEPWIIVSDLNNDTQVCVERGNPDGSFSVSVPYGLYQVMIIDEFLDYIQTFYTVQLDDSQPTASPGANLDPDCASPGPSCNAGMFRWFGWNSGYVFLDNGAGGGIAGNAIRDGSEPGVDGLEVVAKWRDGSLRDGAITEPDGYYEMSEITSKLGKMYNIEVDFGLFGITGHSAHDEQYALYDLLDPAPTVIDPDVGGGLILSQQTWEGRRSIVDWGKRIYQGDDNGGISGIVFYATTRNEFDASLQAVEDYEPGIPNVTINLYTLGTDGLPNTPDDVLVNTVMTDNWQMPRIDNPDNPEACDVRGADGTPLVGATPDFIADYCIEVPQAGNTTLPGAYDGGWAFGGLCDPAAGGYDVVTGDCFGAAIEPIPPGEYVVEVVPPEFYQVVKEEDLNVTEGLDLVPQFPPFPCVGDDHFVPDMPDYDSPFEMMDRPLCDKRLINLEAKENAGLDIFLMTTDSGYTGTEGSSWVTTQVVPPPARFMGLSEDDINLNLDTNSLTFGEKKGIPGLAIGIYEFSDDDTAVGRRLTTVYTDATGFWEALVPGGFSANAPIPSGVPPAMYVLVVNDPGPDPANPNPGYDPTYLTEPAVFETFPGKMRWADTPLDPTEAGGAALVCRLPPDAPEIFQVSSPTAPEGADTDITITGFRFGNCPGSAGGAGSGTPCPVEEWPTVTLDDGVDPLDEPLELDLVSYVPADPFNQTAPVFEDVVTATIPASLLAGPYQLTVTSGPVSGFAEFNGQIGPVPGGGVPSRNGMTIHVLGTGYSPTVVDVTPPADPNDPVIQTAIDGAAAGSLILIEPGTYRENVILHKEVKLQGFGPGGAVGAGALEAADFACAQPEPCPPVNLPGEEPFTHIPGSVIDGRFFEFSPGRRAAWNAELAGPATPYGGPATVPSGAAITVVADVDEFGAEDGANNLPPDAVADSAQIDGLGITAGRGFASGGVYVHAFARNLVISNNILEANQGTHGGAISVGQPKGLGGLNQSQNDDVRIHHNRIIRNGGVSYAGGVGIFAGAEDYVFANNDVCGNFSAEYGGGMSHWGISARAQIRDNLFTFNDAVDEGGGVMIGGDESNPPVNCTGDACNLGRGSGWVTFERNLVQANLSNDDGGGVRVLNPLNDRVDIVNNFIVNNVATDHGGGVSLDNASNVRIVNNTVAGNASTHTAEDSILGQSHVAGISADLHSPGFAANDGSTFSDPVLYNNILFDNLAYFWDAGTGTLVADAMIDLEVVSGAPGQCLSPYYTFLSNADSSRVVAGDGTFTSCGAGVLQGNIVADADTVPGTILPGFILPLVASEVGITVELSRFAVDTLIPFFMRPEGTFVGFTDYHLNFAGMAVEAGTNGPVGSSGGVVTTGVPTSWPGFVGAPRDDIDLEVRPLEMTTEMGGDETSSVGPIALYFSTNTSGANGEVPGVPKPWDDADIYAWDGLGGFTRVLDGTAAGLPGAADIDAMVVDGNLFYMSFRAPTTDLSGVGLGSVSGSDIVVYDADADTWTMFFDGSEVGLTANGHNIDAFEFMGQGLLFSMTSPNPNIAFADQDEDLLLCENLVSGPGTSCSNITLYFDGYPDIELGGPGQASEDVDGVAMSGSDIYLTTNGVYSIPTDAGTLSGDGSDVFVCTGAQTIPGGTANITTTCDSVDAFFDFDASNNIDAIDVP